MQAAEVEVYGLHPALVVLAVEVWEAMASMTPGRPLLLALSTEAAAAGVEEQRDQSPPPAAPAW